MHHSGHQTRIPTSAFPMLAFKLALQIPRCTTLTIQFISMSVAHHDRYHNLTRQSLSCTTLASCTASDIKFVFLSRLFTHYAGHELRTPNYRISETKRRAVRMAAASCPAKLSQAPSAGLRGFRKTICAFCGSPRINIPF